MAWNSTSGLTGLEWFPTRRGGVPLSQIGDAAVAKFTSSVTQTQTGVGFPVEHVLGNPILKVDFFAFADLPQSVTTSVFRPNGDSTSGGITGVPNNTVGQRYQNVDEATLDTSDYYSATPSSNHYMNVDSAAATTPVVLAVRIKAVVQNMDPGGFPATIILGPVIAAGNYVDYSNVVSPSDGRTIVSAEWSTNPATGASWTQTEIREFDNTYYMNAAVAQGYDGPVRFYQVWMEVDHVATSPLGSVELTPTADGWVNGTLSASFSKGSGTAYAAVIRKTNSGGSLFIPWIDSGAAQIHGHSLYDLPIVSESGVVTDLGDVTTAAIPLLLDISGTASVDSMPYQSLDREAVYTGRTVQQEFTPGTSPTIGYVKAVVARQDYTTGADLLWKVKRRSDNVQFGGTGTLTAAQLPDSIGTLQVVELNLASTGALVSGTQYYLEFSSTAASGEGWEVAVLNSETAPLTGDGAGYGGTTDQATVAGSESDDKDVPFVVGTVPSAPVVTATAAADHVDVDWTDTGDTFHVYRGGEWIKTTTALTFDDYQARQGVEESYTVKAETDANGTLSLPSTADTATMTAGTAWWLRSNQDPTINLSITPTDDGITFEFLEDRTEYLAYGRDHSIVEFGQENRGERIVMTLQFLTSGAATTQVRSLFDSLLAVRDAVRARDVTDLALLDPFGERWFVSMHVRQGSVSWPKQGFASVVFTTVNPDL